MAPILPTDWINATQAAAYLGLSRARIYQLTEAGKLGALVAGRYLYTRPELDTWAAAKKNGRPKKVRRPVGRPRKAQLQRQESGSV